MPKKSKAAQVRVIREFLDETVRTDYRKKFPRLPRMYLELMENTQRIKPSFLGKEFHPKYDSQSKYSPPESPRPVFNDNASVSSESSNESRGSLDSDSDSDSDRSDTSSINGDEEDFQEDDEGILTKKLKNLLGDDASTESDASSVGSASVRRSIRSKRRTPPTLHQLRETGVYKSGSPMNNVRHNTMTEEEEEDKKREILFKFDMLKKSYKGASIPEYNIHTDYKTMERSYEASVKRLSVDSSVESYKTYLIGGFMAVEFLFGNVFNFDMQGFTQQQILSMSSYEKLLIELGEKSYVPEGSNWPVELRLLFLIVVNAAFFIVSKLILAKTGSNLMNMVNSMNSASTSSGPPPPKRKMKGPSINLDEIPEFG